MLSLDAAFLGLSLQILQFRVSSEMLLVPGVRASRYASATTEYATASAAAEYATAATERSPHLSMHCEYAQHWV